MFWRKNIVLADPFVPIGMKEAGLISGLSSVSFVLAGPILAGYLGAYVACTSTGCALTMAAVSGGTGGTAAGVAGAGLTNLIYRTKYKNWIKENAGKYIVSMESLKRYLLLLLLHHKLLYLLQVEQFILRQFLLFQFLHSLYHTKE
jgi:hypothetical protein